MSSCPWTIVVARVSLCAALFWFACSTPSAPPPAPASAAAAPVAPVSGNVPGNGAVVLPAREGESHLGEVRQLTFGGENAEAYWSPNGAELIFQAHAAPAGCDRIYRLPVLQPRPTPIAVSSGAGATTCAFFVPHTTDVIFSSTHLAGAACPPPPDRSRGYVWAIYPSYDIFRAGADGSNLRRLTDTPGYDAEATTCPVDGSIVFTSVRDGDLDIYRMDADGKNVRRLTHEIGYDGGPVFDGDCTHIAWRASRPRPGTERDEYQRMLHDGLVRPTKLELWMADADGSNAHQVTYLDAASFAPAFFPVDFAGQAGSSQRRLIFSSNYGDPRGREFDLWAIDGNGTNLERVTTAPGFDGFPMFSPSSPHLAFSSNRATPPGQHDTNVFVARWEEKTVKRFAETGADRIMADVRWLADPEREGRGVGTPGLESSGTYIEAAVQRAGLKGAAGNGSYRQMFDVPVEIQVAPATRVAIGGETLGSDAFLPAPYSGQGAAQGALVLAGYGIVDKESKIDDYAGLDVKGKIVVVRRFAPEGTGGPPSATVSADEEAKRRRAGDVRRKAFLARERGAKALIVVDQPAAPATGGAPAGTIPDEAPLPALRVAGYGDAGLPVLFVRRAALQKVFARLEKRQPVSAR
ncbi:MAG TPA: PA domain-containing protein, partial [Polyangia bacterium]